MRYKVNQKIWEIRINNPSEKSKYRSVLRGEGVHIDELSIIGISPFKICVSDDWFTTFSYAKKGHRKDRTLNTYLDDVNVSIRVNDSILGDGVFITLYSSREPTSKTFLKMVNKAVIEIDKKYGFLFNGAKDELFNMIDNHKSK